LAIATGCLEDFSLQFIDRVISLIENRTHENTRMADSRITAGQAINAEDSGLEKFVWAVFHRLASHSSTKILKVACEQITSELFPSVIFPFSVHGQEVYYLCSKYNSRDGRLRKIVCFYFTSVHSCKLKRIARTIYC
jgi:hypothetical protein